MAGFYSNSAAIGTTIEFGVVCLGCDICPAYAATDYAVISDADLAKVQKLGFQQEDPHSQEYAN